MANRQREKHIRFSDDEKQRIRELMQEHYGEDMAEEVAYASFLMDAAESYADH